jgi:hypothetical protein
MFTFGAVLEARIADQFSFTLENGILANLKDSVLQYLPGLKAASGRPEFVQPPIVLSITKEAPRAVDHLMLTQNGHTAEFAFYSWAWVKSHNSFLVIAPEPAETTISAYLYPLIRCTASLQIAWIEELYGDDARNQQPPRITFDATPRRI